jgi:hypothetical protein
MSTSSWIPLPGEVVRLNVNGPDVTVDSVVHHRGRALVRILWFEDQRLQDRIVDLRVLEPTTTPRGYSRLKMLS